MALLDNDMMFMLKPSSFRELMCARMYNEGWAKDKILSITEDIAKTTFLTKGTEHLYDVYNHKLSGKKPQEIADIMGIDVEQVRKDILTARRKGKDYYMWKYTTYLVEKAL